MKTCMTVLRKHENWILTALFLTAVCAACALRYDFYYDLNDDVLMKDILAGVYTGMPESRNIQMLYLISAFISFFYRIVPGAPWYGLFLCICQFGSIGLIGYRSLRFCNKTSGKVLLLLTEAIVVTGTLLEHLIFVQYTITCAMLAAAAAFLFYTTDINLSNKAFFKKNILAIILVFAAFLIRTEMLALVLPMICVAGICKWGSESPVFTVEHGKKYFSVLGGILAGLILGQVTNMAAVGSAEWQKFNTFFDNRTQLYDYQEIPEYDQHAAFYESIGLTRSEEILLHNYNFGLDEEIDEKLVGEVADYAAANRKEAKPFDQQFVKKAKEYYHKMTDVGEKSDYPWNALIIIGYAGLLGMGINQRKTGRITWKLMLLFGVRTALWMYILMGDRNPPRISHSLYFMELCILFAMLLVEASAISSTSEANSQTTDGTNSQTAGQANRQTAGQANRQTADRANSQTADRIKGQTVSRTVKTWLDKSFPVLVGALILVTAQTALPDMIAAVDRFSAQREEVNRPWLAMQEYCREHSDNFYFIDVYSSVDYSEKIFANVDNRLRNYDIMGGWACKSPLYRKKLAAFGMETMEKALLTEDHVYMIMELGYDLTWLEEYYRGHGEEIMIVQIDSIADKMGVYMLYGQIDD